MRRFLPLLGLAAAVALSAQTTPKAPTPAPAKAAAATKSSTATTSSTAAAAAGYKLPTGEKRIPGIAKVAVAVKYQDIKIGTGPLGEGEKLWHVKYKGWRAVDGVVFDAWDQHPQPARDKDGKPEQGADGKPKMGDPEPMAFPQGMGRLIPGFDYGVAGMHVGGKRRIFIPWQLAYGTRAMPDRPDHPGIPAKSDLIFDVELVEVTDLPPQQQRPMMPRPGAPGAPGQPGAAPKPAAPATPPTGSAPNTPPPTSQPAAPDTAKPSTPPPTPNPSTTPPPSTPPQPN